MQHAALDDGIPKGAARRAARLRLKPHAGEVRRQRGIAIANSFAIYDNAKGDCGLVKWCYNAMRLMQMPWLAGQAEVVAWTNARGAEFVRAECGPRVQRIVEFDADLEDLARRWAVATADVCKTRGSRCHLGVRSVNDVALLKWQLVRHEEYQLIFLTDTDVDVMDSHYVRSEQEYLMHLQRAWETGLGALLGPSAVTGQIKSPTRYPNRTQLVANPDFESPLNAGVMLFKPSAATYRRGVEALRSMRWNLTHGFELAGSPCDGVPKKAIAAFASYGIRRCSWDFLGANTDQGLFWYVFAVLRHSAARSRVKTYAVKHFWAYYKPWRQTSRFWCRRWYTFLDDDAAFGAESNGSRSGSRCVRELFATRARVLALNQSDGKNKCKGVWSKVF